MTTLAAPRRRSQAARIVRERGDPPRVPAAAAAVVYPINNNSQGLRILASITQARNDLLIRQTTAGRLRSLPATADVLLPGAAERVRDTNLG